MPPPHQTRGSKNGSPPENAHEDMAMTVRELRAALATIEASSEVQVVLFKNDGTSEVFALEEVLSLDGHAQLEIYEAEPVREENPEG
jgi:hypothetical protein